MGRVKRHKGLCDVGVGGLCQSRAKLFQLGCVHLQNSVNNLGRRGVVHKRHVGELGTVDGAALNRAIHNLRVDNS